MSQWVRVGGRVLAVVASITLVVACSSSGGSNGSADDWNKTRTEFAAAPNAKALKVLARIAAAGITCTDPLPEQFGPLVPSYVAQHLPLPAGSASCTGPQEENLLVEVFPKTYPTAADFIQRKREIVCEKALRAGKLPNGKNDFPGVPYLLAADKTWVLEPDSFKVNRQLAEVFGLKSRNACAGMTV